jgi:hypothetical protein
MEEGGSQQQAPPAVLLPGEGVGPQAKRPKWVDRSPWTLKWGA